jgi:hypothetical protein
VKMTHPDIEAAGEVLNRDQFNQVYAPRGWSLMDEPTEFANDQLGRFVRDSKAGEGEGGLTKDEARGLIAFRGGEYPESDADEGAVLSAYHETFGVRRPVPSTPTESPAGVPLQLYDPSAHTVDEVVAYLEAADENEQLRVIVAEEQGKNRVTVTGWKPVDSAEADDQNKEA